MRISMIFWKFCFLVLFLILLGNPIRGENIPCPFSSACQCMPLSPDQFYTVDCSTPFIPWIIARPNSIYTVNLRLQTDLSKIPDGYFSAFKSVKYLVLEHTGQGNQQWSDGAFDRLVIEESLSISGLNGVLPPPIALQQVGEKGLKRLEVHGDRLVRLVDDTFQNFSKLERILINNSVVQTLDDKAFSGSEESLHLEIIDTPLPRFPPIENLGKLKLLVLSNNTLKEIPSKAFSNLRNLTELSLDYNDLASAVDSNAFDDSLPLYFYQLSLKGIGLKSIPISLACLRVTMLNLAENKIKEIGSNDISPNNTWQGINLDKNPISKIENGSFERLRAPTGIRLEETNLTSLDVNICDQLFDCHIHASKNRNLKRLVASKMKKVPSTLVIWLRESGLETIDPKLIDVMNQTHTFALQISGNRNLRCNDMKWMAPIYVCEWSVPYINYLILAKESFCADKGVSFDTFMNEAFPKAGCPPSIVPRSTAHP